MLGGPETLGIVGQDRGAQRGSIGLKDLDQVAIDAAGYHKPVGAGRQNVSRNLDGLIEGKFGGLIFFGSARHRQHQKRRQCESGY